MANYNKNADKFFVSKSEVKEPIESKLHFTEDSLHHILGEDADADIIRGAEFLTVDYGWLKQNAKYIFVDKRIQRFLNPWDKKSSKNFLLAVLRGTSVTQMVIVDLRMMIQTSEPKLENPNLTSAQRENLEETIAWSKKWIKRGYIYHISDGQHRFNWFQRYVKGGKNTRTGEDVPGGKYVPNFDSKKGDSVPISSNGLNVNPENFNVEYGKTPESFKDMFESIPVPLVIINSPNMELVTSVFESVNNGTPLSQIDLITNLWTGYARWLRETEDDPVISTFLYDNFLDEKNIVNRRVLLKVLEAGMYLFRDDSGVYPYRNSIDSKAAKYEAVGPLSKVPKSFYMTGINNVLTLMANGLKDDYNVTTGNTFPLKKHPGQLSSFWLSIVITHMLMNKSTDLSFLHNKFFADDFKDDITTKNIFIENPDEWMMWLYDAIKSCAKKSRYFYFDDKNQLTKIEQKDKNGEVRYAMDENGNPLEDEHSFYRKLTQGRSLSGKSKNGKFMVEMMIDELQNDFVDLINAGTLQLRSNTRTLSRTKKVQYGGRVIKDNQTGRSIDKRTILNPEEIAGTHEMGEAWSKGGDKIGLGDAKLNKRLGAS